MCKMATEAITSGQTSVKAELRRTANTRECLRSRLFAQLLEKISFSACIQGLGVLLSCDASSFQDVCTSFWFQRS